MHRDENDKQDIIDEDLYEEIDDEELYELVEEERRKAWERQREREKDLSEKRPFPRWVFWVIALFMLGNAAAYLPQTFSIPAIEFLATSAKLSANEDIQDYKQAVVVIDTGNSKGTGFAISGDGTILTNHHVIEGKKQITVAFPNEGLFDAEVVESFPEIDLAVLDVKGEGLPHLSLAEQTSFEQGEHIYFIGNPLRFSGIANQGEVIGYKNLEGWEQPVLMLDAPVYRGNSGSPVINGSGNVIGVVFATLYDDEEGRVGLAVPIDYYYDRID